MTYPGPAAVATVLAAPKWTVLSPGVAANPVPEITTWVPTVAAGGLRAVSVSAGGAWVVNVVTAGFVSGSPLLSRIPVVEKISNVVDGESSEIGVIETSRFPFEKP